MNNKTLFYANLFGMKAAGNLPKFESLNNKLLADNLPTIPFIETTKQPSLNSVDFEQKGITGQPTPANFDGQYFPLSFRQRRSINDASQDNWYTFPYEPIIDISGANIIVRKTPAKNDGSFVGSVKENVSQDDYTIKITGTIFGPQMHGTAAECFPREEFQKLRDYCKSRSGIEVRCEPLQLLGINLLVVETFEFPFVSGEEVLAYELQCFSDFTPELLLEIE